MAQIPLIPCYYVSLENCPGWGLGCVDSVEGTRRASQAPGP